jgi:hypothetical protein
MSYRPRLLNVVEGGTGDSSVTAYMPLCGGTTTTGALQSVATGVAGQDLCYNSSSSLPTWQANSVNAAYANQYINFVDDFLVANTPASGSTTGMGWVWVDANTGTIASTSGSAANPGVITLGTGTASASGSSYINGAKGCFYYGGGALTMTFWIQIPTLSTSSQRFSVVVGAVNSSDFGLGTPTNDGTWLQYSDSLNSGDWTYNTASGGTSTNSNSTTGVGTGWTVLQIAVNAGGTSANFLVGSTLANLTSLGTITTNIPTATTVSPYVGIIKSVGTSALTLNIDMFTFQNVLTTAR